MSSKVSFELLFSSFIFCAWTKTVLGGPFQMPQMFEFLRKSLLLIHCVKFRNLIHVIRCIEQGRRHIAAVLSQDGCSRCWAASLKTELSLPSRWWTSLMTPHLSTSHSMPSQLILVALTGTCSSHGLAFQRERRTVASLTLLQSGMVAKWNNVDDKVSGFSILLC